MGFWNRKVLYDTIRLSNLIIDTDKDWGGFRIKNLGTPVSSADAVRLTDLSNHKSAVPIDHPDNSVTAEKFDPPNEGGS